MAEDDLRRAIIDTLARVHELQHDGPRAACPVCVAGLAGWDAQQRAGAIPENPEPAAAPVASAPASTADVAPARPAAPIAPTTPEALHAALEAAPDDAARARLLAAASRDLRAQFNAMLVYRQLNADVEAACTAQAAAFEAFTRLLDAAADDAGRAAIIAATDKAFVAEWTWRVDATADDWRRRFFALANPDEDAAA